MSSGDIEAAEKTWETNAELLLPQGQIGQLMSWLRLFPASRIEAHGELLLGRAWFLYEIAYLFAVALVLAVVGAAIGSIINEGLGVPDWIGTLFLMTTIAILAFKGTQLIEGIMSAWSFVLYAVYAGILILSIFAVC